jgi:hypothetical protein
MPVSSELWERIQADSEWYRVHRQRLIREHGGQFIAIESERICARASTMDSLIVELKKGSIDPRTCVVEYVPRPGESLQMIRTF